MTIYVNFTVYDEDIEKWEKIRRMVLARHGKLRGKIGKGILDLAMKGAEYERKEKIPVKRPQTSRKKRRRLINLYNELPAGRFSEKLIHKKLYKMGRFSEPTIRSHINLLEAAGMILHHHTEQGLNPRTSITFYEKGGKEDLEDWVKSWMTEEEKTDSK